MRRALRGRRGLEGGEGGMTVDGQRWTLPADAQSLTRGYAGNVPDGTPDQLCGQERGWLDWV